MRKILITSLVLILISLPYLIAANSGAEQTIFGGFLLNPKDGNSYLAKMQQGFNGAWLFRLPFTAETGNGQPLFIFYLFLGHLAKWINLPLLWVFHGARVIAAGFLLWTIHLFSRKLFPEKKNIQDLFFLLSSIGSGMGWILSGFGILTSDLWVAESFPFLSMYVNPHFPLGLAILILLLNFETEKPTLKNGIVIFLLGLGLSVILPFGVMIAAIIFFINWLWNCKDRLAIIFPMNEIGLLPGVAWVGVQYFLTINDSLLKIWNEQNVTPSPQIWDWVISFSPALILFFFTLNKDKSPNSTGLWRAILIWSAVATIIQVIPFSLQRRFLMGFYIPLSAFSIRALTLVSTRTRKWMTFLLIGLSLPTNLLILLLGFVAAQNQPPVLFLSKGEAEAYQWIDENLESGAIILCAPETGLRIPAWTGRKVVYGHEFETVNAIEKKKDIEQFFKNPKSKESELWLREQEVNFLFIGPNEKSLLVSQEISVGEVIFSKDEYSIVDLSAP